MTALGVEDFLQRAIGDGRIANAGFSFHGLAEDFTRIVDEYPWVFCQIQYNFLDQENQAGSAGLRYAAAKDLAVIVMEPLRGGNIGLPVAPPAVEQIWQSAAIKRTPVEWALRWVWNHPEVTLVLSGMNEESHIEENLWYRRLRPKPISVGRAGTAGEGRAEVPRADEGWLHGLRLLHALPGRGC